MQLSENFPQSKINWRDVKRVLVVRLRSIGDTVLATPSLIALRRFLPEAQIDILLEDWVAPILEGFESIDNVLTLAGKDKKSRFETAWRIRRTKYDVAFNMHGGTTATFFVRASGARNRIGFDSYQYKFLYNTLVPTSKEFWQGRSLHSAEQQLALLECAGIPLPDLPKSHLAVTEQAKNSIEARLRVRLQSPDSKIAMFHPAAAFDTKQWATKNFARTAEVLADQEFQPIAVAAPHEIEVLETLKRETKTKLITFSDLSLPEITALAARAEIFIGNDSGIAHIAAAVETPSVVIFGSSNIKHWRPWTKAPNEIVYEKMPCQPCPGYFCKEFAEPECIKRVSVESVIEAIKKVMTK